MHELLFYFLPPAASFAMLPWTRSRRVLFFVLCFVSLKGAIFYAIYLSNISAYLTALSDSPVADAWVFLCELVFPLLFPLVAAAVLHRMWRAPQKVSANTEAVALDDVY